MIVDDFRRLSTLVVDTLRGGLDRDWSAPAGTLEWSCAYTLDHTVDCVFSYALFLASRRQANGYPPFAELHALPEATPADLIEGLQAVSTMLLGVIAESPPDVRAIIRRNGELAAPDSFAERGSHELILHAHDICSGLGLTFDPPRDICERILEHRGVARSSDDAWADLLAHGGRAPNSVEP